MAKKNMTEHCAICNCTLKRKAGTYALPTPEGRAHATRHHLVAKRFFGRFSTRRGMHTEGIFQTCPWNHEKETALFCYECHEELLHNPVLLREDIDLLASLVKLRGLDEEHKTADRSKLGDRIMLLHEALARGLRILVQEHDQPRA